MKTASRDEAASSGTTPRAETIIEHHRRTDLRTVLWDGIAHTSASGPGFGLTAGDGDNVSIGSVLREHLGPAYASVAIGFHHGNLGVAEVPAPAPDLVDAALGESALTALWMDLRTTPVPRRPHCAPSAASIPRE